MRAWLSLLLAIIQLAKTNGIFRASVKSGLLSYTLVFMRHGFGADNLTDLIYYKAFYCKMGCYFLTTMFTFCVPKIDLYIMTNAAF